MDTRSGRIYSDEQVKKLPPPDLEYMVQMGHHPTPLQREKGKIGRNEPCPCGSGKKFKKCHLWRSTPDTGSGDGR